MFGITPILRENGGCEMVVINLIHSTDLQHACQHNRKFKRYKVQKVKLTVERCLK